MDEDLKTYLRGMEDRIAALVAGEIGSLHTDIQASEARLSAKIDVLSARLDVHAGLLQSGSRQFVRLFRFTERSGKYWQELAKRVDALEKKAKKKA